MKLCVVSFKECWLGRPGEWLSDGGFPRQMAALASLFDETTLVTPSVPARAGGIALPRAMRMVPLPCPAGVDARRKLSVMAGLTRYVGLIAPQIRDADIVHVPLPGDLPFLGMLIAQALRKPLLARYGSSWAVNGETTLMNRVIKRWMRLAAGGRNVMVATGHDELPPAPRMHWIFASALWAEELRALRPRIDRGLSTPPRLVYAGRLSPEKGVSVLLRALARIEASAGEDDRGRLPCLAIAGDGPARAALEDEARRLLAPGRVTFLGQLDRPALSRCLHAADLCVQPSLTEGFSKAWLDAMAHGLPVIASDVGAARAAIGMDGARGLLAPPGDDAALAALIARMLREPRDWPALRARCVAFVQSHTLDAWAARAGALCAAQWHLALVDGKLRPWA